MSRIGKLPIKVPKNITVNIQNDNILIKGPTGELTQKIPKEINISFNENTITLKPNEDTRLANQKYGLLRSLIKNMVLGAEKKFEQKLQMIGVGYKAQVQSNKLTVNAGYTHPVIFDIPNGMDVTVEANSNLTIKGSNKDMVGLLAAKIRATQPPEPYKGKGIRYVDEIILRKAGKSGKK